MSWSYFAQRVIGDGNDVMLDAAIPLEDVEITREWSGPGGLTASLPHHMERFVAPDGAPLFQRWGTAIWAEESGTIRGGGLLADIRKDGDRLELECVGYSGYLEGLPYTESWFMVEEDPLVAVREMWRHAQAQPGGNLGLQVDATTTTPVRIGTEMEVVDFETAAGERVVFEAGPYKLSWYGTHNMGAAQDALAQETPFAYYETHTWGDGEAIDHRLHFVYPDAGRRLTAPRFVLGENVYTVPAVETNEEHATQVLFIGSGEGRDAIHALSSNLPGSLRRCAVVTDRSVRSKRAAATRARSELAARRGLEEVPEIAVLDHPNAPLGTFDIGDEVFVQARSGWIDVEAWCRILSITIRPDSPEMVILGLIRSDRLGA